MLNRLETSVLSKNPDWMMLSCGVYDVGWYHVGLDDYKIKITSIVDQAQAKGDILMAKGVLQGLGVNPSDFPKIEAAWDLIPDAVQIRKNINSFVKLTLVQNRLLIKEAAQRNLAVGALTDLLYLNALKEVAKKHESDFTSDLVNFQNEVQQVFDKEIKKIADKAS